MPKDVKGYFCDVQLYRYGSTITRTPLVYKYVVQSVCGRISFVGVLL